MKACLIVPLFGQEDAIKHYSKILAEGLPKYGVETDVIACQPKERSYFKSAYYDLVHVPIALLKKRGFDVYHALMPNSAFYFPFMRSNTVVTFHDLIPFFYNEYGYSALGMAYIRTFLRMAARSKHIITNSQQTKDDLIKFFKVPESKITAIPHAAMPSFTPLKKRPNDVPVIGYLGGFGVRRNVMSLLEAASILNTAHPEFKYRVDIYGKPKGEYQRMVAAAKTMGLDNVRFCGPVPQENLVEVYNSFDVFVFPSLMEGFGLPPLEAKKCGKPAIVKEGAHIPSEVTDGCLKYSTEKDLAEKMRLLLTDKNAYKRAVGEALRSANKLNWDDCVKKTAEVYAKIASA